MTNLPLDDAMPAGEFDTRKLLRMDFYAHLYKKFVYFRVSCLILHFHATLIDTINCA